MVSGCRGVSLIIYRTYTTTSNPNYLSNHKKYPTSRPQSLIIYLPKNHTRQRRGEHTTPNKKTTTPQRRCGNHSTTEVEEKKVERKKKMRRMKGKKSGVGKRVRMRRMGIKERKLDGLYRDATKRIQLSASLLVAVVGYRGSDGLVY